MLPKTTQGEPMYRNISVKKIVFSLCLLLTFSSLAKSKLVLSINLEGQDVYSIDGDHLRGTQSIIGGQMNIAGRFYGESINVNQGIPVQKVENQTKMVILDKNKVRLIEPTHNINTLMRAKVKKSMFGNLKSISVKSEEYLAVMKPVFEQQGLDILSNFQISDESARLETKIEMSDIECVADNGELECDSQVKIIISVEEL